MMLALDHPACADPETAGGKAAWLARGMAAGLNVLPGFVVEARSSVPYLELGFEALGRRGSGGARLEVSSAPLPSHFASEITDRSRELGSSLVVRSSSVLEVGGEWSGAFTSYLDVTPDQVPKAVTGCWASAFTVATLERHEAAGVEPGSAPMAVLVQPALDPRFGGTARLESGDVTVGAVAGSPAPLVQGWEPGVHARLSPDGEIRGDDALALVGHEILSEVAQVLRSAGGLGADTMEWAVCDGAVVVLQLNHAAAPESRPEHRVDQALGTRQAELFGRLVRRFPGPLGESLVLPWAVGDPHLTFDEATPGDLAPSKALAAARRQASQLVSDVWEMPQPEASETATRTLRALRAADPAAALATLAELRPPDPELGRSVLSHLTTVRQGLVLGGAVTSPTVAWHVDPAEAADILGGSRRPQPRRRIGFDRWEPFLASVVTAGGRQAVGVSAADGIACGRLCAIAFSDQLTRFRPRDVIVAPHPTQYLAALLWDAAAIVTIGGGPAAHLFESARALGIPAVAGIQLDDILGGDPMTIDAEFALAVDGRNGAVYATDW